MNANHFNDIVERWREPSTDVVVSNAADVISTSDSATAWADFLHWRVTPSGYVVNDKTSMQSATVYRCVGLIGGAVAQLPLHHFRKGKNGAREKVEPASPLWWLLNESPIDAWTAASWKEFIVQCVLLRGDAFAELVRGRDQITVTAIRPLHPDAVQVLRRADGTLLYVVTMVDGDRRVIVAEDMLHFAGLGFDGMKSMSVIQWAAKNAIANALAAADFAGRSFNDGAMPQIALQYAGELNAEQLTQLRESFAATYGAGKGRKLPLVLAEGGKIEKIGISPQDGQLLETRAFEKHDIYTAFGVPPIMGGDNEKTSSWGTGIEQITIGFVRYTLKPHLVRWEEELNRKLFQRAGPFVEFEIAGLLRGDAKAQVEYFRGALGGPGSGPGWMAVDEVRALQNLPPIGGDHGNKPFYPETGKANETQAPEPPEKQRPGPPEPPKRE